MKKMISNIMINNYWNSFHWFEERYRLDIGGYIRDKCIQTVDDALKNKCSIIDAACGYNNPFLSERNLNGIKMIGVDIDPSVKDHNQIHDVILIQDMHELDTRDKYEVLFSVYTWEHLKNPQVVLKRINRSLTEDGVLIIIASNKWGVISIIDRMLTSSLRNFAWKIVRG